MTLYFDHSSTTPLDPTVAEQMAECRDRNFANPSSQHRAGQEARSRLELYRDSIANSLGAARGDIQRDYLIFTGGATEANNLAIFGFCCEPGSELITSPMEHASIVGVLDELRRRNVIVHELNALPDGTVDLNHLRELLHPGIALVSLQVANHETGVLQPVDEVSNLCREVQVPLHSDAAQSAGKLPLDFAGRGFSAVTVSPHKFHGPVGIGGLLVKRDQLERLQPLIFGGFQQAGYRPGTESIELACGFAAALELWDRERGERIEKLKGLQSQFEATLAKLCEPGQIFVNGQESSRLPTISNVSFAGLERQALFMALDFADVACSTGSACASGSSERSPVLTAMGLSEERIEGALRFSFGCTNQLAEVELGCERISGVINQLRQRKDRHFSSGSGRKTSQKPI